MCANSILLNVLEFRREKYIQEQMAKRLGKADVADASAERDPLSDAFNELYHIPEELQVTALPYVMLITAASFVEHLCSRPQTPADELTWHSTALSSSSLALAPCNYTPLMVLA